MDLALLVVYDILRILASRRAGADPLQAQSRVEGLEVDSFRFPQCRIDVLGNFFGPSTFATTSE